MNQPVYETDPNARSDEDFLPGELSYLVTGNRGRLLDPRRTPVVVTDVAPNEGGFEVQIEAFEGQGARWELPLEEVGRFQFEHGASRAAPRWRRRRGSIPSEAAVPSGC